MVFFRGVLNNEDTPHVGQSVPRQKSNRLTPEYVCRTMARSEPGGTRWRTGREVKGKLANGVGSQYSHAISGRGLSSITQADAHTSSANSRLNWRPHRFKWTRPFRGKTKSGFCACAITFRTSYTCLVLHRPSVLSWMCGGNVAGGIIKQSFM